MWVGLTVTVQRDAQGVPQYIIVILRDISIRMDAQSHQQFLFRELAHRLKNQLAIIQRKRKIKTVGVWQAQRAPTVIERPSIIAFEPERRRRRGVTHRLDSGVAKVRLAGKRILIVEDEIFGRALSTVQAMQLINSHVLLRRYWTYRWAIAIPYLLRSD